MNAEPSRCAVVEDTPSGVTAAVSAGMRALGYAADSDELALRAGGAEILRSLEELPALLGLADPGFNRAGARPSSRHRRLEGNPAAAGARRRRPLGRQSRGSRSPQRPRWRRWRRCIATIEKPAPISSSAEADVPAQVEARERQRARFFAARRGRVLVFAGAVRCSASSTSVFPLLSTATCLGSAGRGVWCVVGVVGVWL